MEQKIERKKNDCIRVYRKKLANISFTIKALIVCKASAQHVVSHIENRNHANVKKKCEEKNNLKNKRQRIMW